MRWQLKLAVFWSGVLVPGLMTCLSPELATSTPYPFVDEANLTVAQSSTTQSLLQAQSPTPLDVLPDSQQDDRFLQPNPQPLPVSPAEQTPIVPPSPIPAPTPPSLPPTSPAPAEPSTQPEVQIPVSRIEVLGSTVFNQTDFAPIVQPFEGRSLTLEQLRSVADQITQLYLDRGYITSRAILVDQTIQNGLVQIRAIEGAVERIEIEGTHRVNPSYIRSRVRLGGHPPLNQTDLEDQLRLLRLDPLFENVEASLQAGSGLGLSILTVRVSEADPLVGSLSVDNFSPPSIGSERLGAGLSYRSLTGLGDELSGSYYHSTTSGSDAFDFSYRLPINPMDGTIQLRVSPNSYRVTDRSFADLGITGSSELYELSYRQPLVRSPREEFALSLGLSYQNGQTFLSDRPTPFQIGPDANGISRTSVFKFGQDYVHRDPQGAWALRSQFSLGTGLFDATTNQGNIPDGQFFAWLGQAQRVQVLDNSNLLILQTDVQLTPDPLLPSQVFTIGGGQSLRGYRQNARSGDNGFRISVEDRLTIQRDESGAATIQVAPFFDAGAVWNVDDNPNPQLDQTFLAGVGLGLLWEMLPGLNIRVDFTVPLVNLDDRGVNAQDDGFYFSVIYQP